MRLIHYSNCHLTEVRDADQCVGRSARRGDKPNGLWVSVEGEDDWLSWCLSERFAEDRITHPTEVVIGANASILHLKDESDLRHFHNEFWCHPPWSDRKEELFRGDAIRWHEVASLYDGIIIAPYIYSMRTDDEVKWYYGWDCASGCIWNSRAVAELVPLPTLQHSDDRTDASSLAGHHRSNVCLNQS